MKRIFVLMIAALMSSPAWAQDGAYKLQPGDMLDVSIWGEENMRRQVIVLPDGNISYPLIGQIQVADMSLKQAESELKRRLIESKYYVDPALTVAVVNTRGNEVFVVGRVRQPGSIAATRRLDVMQALSLAGGLDQFAHGSGIFILRRGTNGKQKIFPFNYDDIHTQESLANNILLQPGDVVVVPEVGLFTGIFPASSRTD